MLSTAKIRTGSWRYYANQVGHGASEYFLGVGEAPGRWYGRGLEPLGLTARGEVREWQLEATFGRATHPTERSRLGRAWRADGVTGYDLCFSAPKSVSALRALGGADIGIAVQAAHTAAVRAGLDYLDNHAAFSRVGRNGHTQVGTAGLAAAVFDHRVAGGGSATAHARAGVEQAAVFGWVVADLTTPGEQTAAHTRLANPPILPSRTPPKPVPAAAEPVRRPAREPEPYQLIHQREEPYRGISRYRAEPALPCTCESDFSRWTLAGSARRRSGVSLQAR